MTTASPLPEPPPEHCLLVPIYSAEQAVAYKHHFITAAKAARASGCTAILLEFPRDQAQSIQAELGPLVYKDLKVLFRYRDAEPGNHLWAIPPMKEPARPVRETTVYRAEPNKAPARLATVEPGAGDNKATPNPDDREPPKPKATRIRRVAAA